MNTGPTDPTDVFAQIMSDPRRFGLEQVDIRDVLGTDSDGNPRPVGRPADPPPEDFPEPVDEMDEDAPGEYDVEEAREAWWFQLCRQRCQLSPEEAGLVANILAAAEESGIVLRPSFDTTDPEGGVVTGAEVARLISHLDGLLAAPTPLHPLHAPDSLPVQAEEDGAVRTRQGVLVARCAGGYPGQTAQQVAESLNLIWGLPRYLRRLQDLLTVTEERA